LVKPEPLPDDAAEEQRKQFQEISDRYRKANSHAKSMVTAALTEDTYQKVMYKGSAREVWAELRRNLEPSSKDQLFSICSEFFSFSWNSPDDVSVHVVKIKTLWNELSNGLQSKGEKRIPEMMLMCKTLHILPCEYQSFKSSWMLLSDDRQSVDELIMQLCSFERDMNSDDVGRTNQEALFVKPVKLSHSQRHPQKPKFDYKKVKSKCNYCHEPGHLIKSCSKWIADGKPPKPSKPQSMNTCQSGSAHLVST